MYSDVRELIRLPYSVARVIRKQDRFLTDTVLFKYIGRRMTDELLNQAAKYIRYKCGIEEIPLSFFAMPLDKFRNKTLPEDAFAHVLKRIIAATEMYVGARHDLPLQQSISATDWTSLPKAEWTPVFVERVEPKGEDSIDTWILRCRVLAGTLTDNVINYTVSLRTVYRIARLSGFNQRSETAKLFDAKQLVLLRLLLRVREGSTPEHISIETTGEHTPFTTYNRMINKFRDLRTRQCPEQLRVPCYKCGVGQDQCVLATIPTTLETRYLSYYNTKTPAK